MRHFYGSMSLVELKIRVLQQCPSISEIIVSSDDDAALELAAALGARPLIREAWLCSDEVRMADVLTHVLAGLEESLIYWAHPTSPFVSSITIESAVRLARENLDYCVFGVERLYEFLWSADGPVNYVPERQPRSQDLSALWRVAGGLHLALGARMIEHSAHTFSPHIFVEMARIEALDINNLEDWKLCSQLAQSVMPCVLRVHE
jgi:CMP-N-acetylneuraminic acid synthetase